MMRGLGRDVVVLAAITGVSTLGDVAVQVALVLRVHGDAGSAWAVTALLLAANVPPMFLARWAGALVDRCDSRVLMVSCALSQALMCLVLAMSSAIQLMVLLVAGLAVFAAAAGPARNALVPDLVAAPDLLRVNALLRGVTAIGRMAGWPLGGFLAATLGSSSVLLLDAVSFVVMAAGTVLIRARRVPGRSSGSDISSRVRVWIAGTGDRRLLLQVAGSVGLVLLFVSTTNVVQVFFVKDVLGAGDTGYGVIGACWMVGMVLAVPVMARGRCTPNALTAIVLGSEAVTGLAVLGAGLAPSVAVVSFWYLIGGLGSGAMLIAGATLIQLMTPRPVRGRVLASYSALGYAATVVALALSAWLMSWLGARGVFVTAGAFAILVAALLAGMVTAFSVPSGCRSPDDSGYPALAHGASH